MICNRCRAKPGTPLDFFVEDEYLGSGHLCDECRDEVRERLKRFCRIYDELIARGFTHEQAASAIRRMDDQAAG